MHTDRATFLTRNPELAEGMPVQSSNGDNLGKVVSLDADSFTIQKGFFFPKDFIVRYDDIDAIRDGAIRLKFSGSDLKEWREESYPGWEQTEQINEGRIQPVPRNEFKDRYAGWSNEQVRVPIVEEELEAKKTARQAGEVKLRKVVHTELRHFTVPVMKEEVRVERVPVEGKETELRAGEEKFEKKTVNIPVMEEEVTVSKRPVVKEEVRVSKERSTEERRVEGEIRKEEVKVEGEDKLKKRKAG